MNGTNGRPWSDNVEKIIKQENRCFEILENVCQERGYDDESCRKERHKVETRIEALLQQVVEEMSFDKKKFVKKGILDVDNMNEVTDMSSSLENGFIKKEVIKEDKYDKISDIKPILEQQFIKNEEMEQESLCEPLENSFSYPLSTEEKLKLLKKFVKLKEGEKEVLSQAYASVKEIVETTGREVEWAKSLAFEHKLISNSITSVSTKECKEKLEGFHRKLDDQLKNRKCVLQNFHTQLASIWQSLSKDISERKTFFSDLNSCAGSTIDTLTDELSCLEEIKKSKYQQFVEFSRKELDSWWKKCFYSEPQKKEFIPFFSTDYTEELLQLHVQELEKVKNFYNSNIGMFKLLHQRQKLWNMMTDIENKAYDPSRLFDNRGGQLLQEEKEKKMVQKDLPKIEEELLKKAKSYKKQNGHDFFVHGCALPDVLKQEKIDYQKNKEQKRIQRKYAREQERLLDVTAGKNSITKSNCRKRKLCDTPSTDITTSKKPLICSSQSVSRSGKILRPIHNTVKSCKTAKKVLYMSGPVC